MLEATARQLSSSLSVRWLSTSLARWRDKNWLAACALALMVASEYKWRVRDARSSLTGQLDPTTLVEIAIYALVAICLLNKAPVARAGRTLAPLGWSAAYTGFLCLSVGWSPYGAVAAVRALETVVVLLLAWVAYRRCTREDFHRLAHGFMVLVAGSVVLGAAIHFPGIREQQGRFTWLMVHPTSAAVFMGASSVIAVIYMVEWSGDTAGVRWRPWMYAALLAVTLSGLVASRTRGAIFGAVAGLLVLAILLRPVRRRLTGFALLVWLVALVGMTASEAIVEYLARGESATKLVTLNERTDLWAVAGAAFVKEPLLGYGLNASRGIFVDSTGLGGGHNFVVNIAVDLGLVGLFLWSAMLFSLGSLLWRLNATARRTSSVDRNVVICLLAFFVVDGISIAGIGGVSNVAAIWLYLLVAWSAKLASLHPRLHRPRTLAGMTRSRK